jgi:hypothetical protein
VKAFFIYATIALRMSVTPATVVGLLFEGWVFTLAVLNDKYKK